MKNPRNNKMKASPPAKNIKIAGSRKDLKKYGIDTDYKGGDPAMDATIEAIKKDPEMKHMWGLGDRWKVKKKSNKKTHTA
tara:strand:+ start:871 stop:1110 length:240 start_codon:yes stop_codon:yes gene_type:complete